MALMAARTASVRFAAKPVCGPLLRWMIHCQRLPHKATLYRTPLLSILDNGLRDQGFPFGSRLSRKTLLRDLQFNGPQKSRDADGPAWREQFAVMMRSDRRAQTSNQGRNPIKPGICRAVMEKASLPALILALSPAALPALAFEHADSEPASGIHHLLGQLGLRAAPATRFFPGLRPGQLIATVEIHPTRPAKVSL
jgi:hypothetical protein